MEAFKQRWYKCLLCRKQQCFLQEGAGGGNALTSEKEFEHDLWDVTSGGVTHISEPISSSKKWVLSCGRLWWMQVGELGAHSVMT